MQRRSRKVSSDCKSDCKKNCTSKLEDLRSILQERRCSSKILLLGPAGSGKSHLLKTLLEQQICSYSKEPFIIFGGSSGFLSQLPSKKIITDNPKALFHAFHQTIIYEDFPLENERETSLLSSFLHRRCTLQCLDLFVCAQSFINSHLTSLLPDFHKILFPIARRNLTDLIRKTLCRLQMKNELTPDILTILNSHEHAVFVIDVQKKTMYYNILYPGSGKTELFRKFSNIINPSILEIADFILQRNPPCINSETLLFVQPKGLHLFDFLSILLDESSSRIKSGKIQLALKILKKQGVQLPILALKRQMLSQLCTVKTANK